MDPISALGLTCNVLDLVDRAIKCGKVVYKIQKDGFTDDQADLETIADTMEEVVTGLKQAPANNNIRKSALDPEIVKLLFKTSVICTNLRDLIKKCQPEKKGSWRSAFGAAIVKMVKKSEIESLKTDLETCRSNLTVLFSASAQYDTGL